MSKIKIFILSMMLMGCSDKLTLKQMIEEARSRPYGTVCDSDDMGKYCLQANSPTTPDVMVDFDECVKDARKEKTQKAGFDHAEWCACLANGWHLNLGVELYKCGVKYSFKVIRTQK